MANQFGFPRFKAIDGNGNPIRGGLLYTYSAGTTTNKATYSDYACSVANTNPVVLDSNGEATLYLTGTYKMNLKTSAAAQVPGWPIDNIEASTAVLNDYYYPDYSATDQGVTGSSNTIKYAVDTIGGTNKGTIFLRHNSGSATTDYTLTTSETITSNIKFVLDVGAKLTGAGSLTANGPVEMRGGSNITLSGASVLTIAGELTVEKGATIVHGGTSTVSVTGSLKAGSYQVFSGFAAGDVTGLKEPMVEWFGGKGDDLTDCTSAFSQAEGTAFASSGIISLGSGIYRVTATSGNFAIISRVAIKGISPLNSIIKNVGTGSALKFHGSNDVAGDFYYKRSENFSVVGNASSEDGIYLNPTGGIHRAVAYSAFHKVDSHGHGRHGLVHRASWATKYYDCKFYENGGLGVYLYPEATELEYDNNVQFYGCDSRWNGGIGNAGADYLKGGVRVSGGATNFLWFGGVVESNNAWGFILGHDTVTTMRVGAIKNVNFEDNPNALSSSTVGGNIRVAEKYQRIEVNGCWGTYGAAAGATGYGFYIANTSVGSSYFKEWGNYLSDVGAGTNVRDYGLLYDWHRPYVSKTLSAGTTTILTANSSGQWVINGFINIKWQGYNHKSTYPFMVFYDGGAGGLIALVASPLNAFGGTAPTLTWNAGNLELVFDTAHYGYVELSLGGYQSSPPTTFEMPTAVWGDDFVKRSNPS